MARKRPAPPSLAILPLTLGIGVGTAVFSIVNAVALQSLPYKDADRVVMLWNVNEKSGFDLKQQKSMGRSMSVAEFLDWQRDGGIFDRRECIRAKSRAERLSAIPELFKNSTFDSYTPHNLRQERALALMQGDPGGSWYLTGAYGNGKTHLLYAQSRELVLNRRVFRISIHPDGDRIAFSAPDSTSGNEIWVLENFLSQLKNPSR